MRWYLAGVALTLLVGACVPPDDRPPLALQPTVVATAQPSLPTRVAAPTLTPQATLTAAVVEPTRSVSATPAKATLIPTLTRPTSMAPPANLFIPAPGSPISVPGGLDASMGDVNQDGNADLVVSSGTERHLTVLLGQRDGTLHMTAGSPISVSEAAGEMVLADLNGDGALDVAFVSFYSDHITLLQGNGKGDFSPAPTSPITVKVRPRPAERIKVGIETGDVNGDGKLDIVTFNTNGNDISIALGDGQGGFTRAANSPSGASKDIHVRAIGDLTGDGYADLVAASPAETGRALILLVGDGRGGFQRTEVAVRTPRPWLATIGDVNGDDKPDIVATHMERNELSVLLGDGGGRFTEASGSPFDLGHSGWGPVIVDLNRDGKPDVAAASDGLRVMLGDGQGGFTPAPGSPFATGKGPWRTMVGDINSDGKPDMATSHLEGDRVSVLLGQ